MLKTLLLLFTSLFALSVKAQTSADTISTFSKKGEEVFTAVEMQPEFRGGMGKLYEFIANNLVYPPLAAKNKVSGRVVATFLVEKNGTLSNIKIVSGIGSGCDEEVVRVLSGSPAWMPGIQNGRPVRVQYSMPVMFNIDGVKP